MFNEPAMLAAGTSRKYPDMYLYYVKPGHLYHEYKSDSGESTTYYRYHYYGFNAYVRFSSRMTLPGATCTKEKSSQPSFYYCYGRYSVESPDYHKYESLVWLNTSPSRISPKIIIDNITFTQTADNGTEMNQANAEKFYNLMKDAYEKGRTLEMYVAKKE